MYHELLRILKLLRHVFRGGVVEWLFENVDSADAKAIELISADLDALPWRSCASQVCHMRRPRLYW